ncbi:hypothetical protein AKJ09_10090 [Labilithrix luteola]|uniref:Uncharacterized protein n=1 Tax=Labilithrix luteola TaxID=1391654 RepID=A0A0K1QCN9_9BACT|nr:hypothetical protein AKJ09_10090 [Labilithrix luteola]
MTALSLGIHISVAALLLGSRHPTQEASGDPAPRLAGDTFELPAPDLRSEPLANASPSPATNAGAPSSPDEADDGALRAAPPVRAPAAAKSSHPSRPSGGHAESPNAGESSAATNTGTLYGAVGDRSATDLAAAFARSFTQTASADRAWERAPLGSAGSATVVLAIDDEGHITDVRVEGAPSPALTSSIQRTMALIKGRTFVAHDKVTRIRLAATITNGAEANDGLSGDRFGLSVHGGKAAFVLPIGRRIQLDVK